MSTSYPPPPPAASRSAQAKPFWKRWWFWAAVVVLIIIIAVSSSGGDGKDAADPSATISSPPAGSSAAASPGVSKGLGTSDASKDVTVSKLRSEKDEFGNRSYSVDVKIENRTSKRSNYVVTIALTSADGKQQLDTATVLAENLEAGQSKSDKGDFLELSLGQKKVPDGAKVVLQEVQRTAA